MMPYYAVEEGWNSINLKICRKPLLLMDTGGIRHPAKQYYLCVRIWAADE